MRRIGAPISAVVRTAVMALLFVTVRLTWSVRVHGLAHDPRVPHTYYAITHKRDFDSMAPVPRVLLHRGWRAVFGEVRFAMRSDSFGPGFLPRVMRAPGWVLRLLHPVSLAGVVRALGVMPLQKVSIRPLEEWIADCRRYVGNVTGAEALTPATRRTLAAAGRVDEARVARARLARLLRWRYHTALIRDTGSAALASEARRTTERAVAERARRFLAEISAWMRAGGSVYSAPEGQLSVDGHLSRITSGFHRVLRDAPSDALVVPIAIVYDFMTVGRARMFIDVARPIERAPTLSRDALDARLRTSWMRAARYTGTQLATGYLVSVQRAGQPAFAESDLLATVMRQARDLHASGRAVDHRLLARRGARRRVRRYLAYLERQKQIERVSRGRWTLRPFALQVDAPAGELGYRTAPLAYAWNELQDMGVPTAPPGASATDQLSA